MKLKVSSPKDLEACYQARTDFKYYVIGMSLARLCAQVEERVWVTTKYEEGFRQFLESKPDEHQFHALETKPNWTSKLTKNFLLHANITEGLHLDSIALEQKLKASDNFDIDLARVIHQILRFRFGQIVQNLNDLQTRFPPPEFRGGKIFPDQQPFILQSFTEIFAELVSSLFALSSFTSKCEDLFSLYREAINVPRRKSHNSTFTMPGKRDRDEDDEEWLASYINWVKKIVRQAGAAGLLTGLNNLHYENQLRELQIELIEATQPSEEMEDWKETISQIYSRRSTYSIAGQDSNWSTSQEVLRCLQLLANNASLKVASCYSPLIGWEFKGAIHCEATIGCQNIVGPIRDSRSPEVKIGVSKRCCMVCAYILQEVTRLSVSSSANCSIAQLSVGYFGNSNKIFPCALPTDCPLKVAEKVSERLDTLLQEKLTESLPSLKRKTESMCYGSPGSNDGDNSDDDYHDDFMRMGRRPRYQSLIRSLR